MGKRSTVRRKTLNLIGLVTKELDTFVKGTVFSEITQQVKRNEYGLVTVVDKTIAIC